MLHQRQVTIPTVIRDRPEWHRGRMKFGLWLVNLCKEEICGYIEQAKEYLSDFLLKPYHRQPHISLFICGFLTDAAYLNDDYTTKQFDVHAELLRHAYIKPFTIEVGELNSFASAPYLEVEDPENGIGRVRSILSTTTKEIGRNTYIPHITIGLYSGAFPSGVVVKKINVFPSRPVRFKVEQLTFATYEAREIAGSLTSWHDVVLRV